MRKPLALLLPLSIIACQDATSPRVQAANPELSTIVPGQQAARYDEDDNGYPDVGKVVTGKYESLYAEDASGDYYWDLGDGRIQGTVGSVAELDPATLTTCYYQVHYRGSFENDPFLDTGWISNNIRCVGSDEGTFNYMIVHQTDPRYEANPDWAIWGTWEYHVLTESHFGNWVRPENAVGGN